MKFISNMWAEVVESARMAMGSLTAHKLRSALTLLGVLVGVFSIIVVMTAMRAMQRRIESDFSSLGSQTFEVSTWPDVSFGGYDAWLKYHNRQNISLAQAQAVEKRATLAANIGLEIWLTQGTPTSDYSKGVPNAYLVGETPGGFATQNWVLDEGRIFTDADMEGQHNICVLGNTLATNLFPFGSPLGQKINFSGSRFTVVGVLESSGAIQGGRQDNFAVVPLPTGVARFTEPQRANYSILVEAQSVAAYEETVDQVRGLLRVLRKVAPGKDDDFEINSNDAAIEQVRTFTSKVRVGISIVSSVALLAAGIGIMNIMLVSVTERTREIGVRRAVGAKKRHVMFQFIMEAILLCEIGGVIGVAFGVIGGNLVARYLLKFPIVLPLDWMAIGLGICSAVGIIFGAYPAHKAANLDPIESLRHE